jgi:hypothetical protein
VKFACAIGSAGYPWFTELNVCSARQALGKDVPIVITEDTSGSTTAVEAMAARRDCYLDALNPPMGHFHGDIQTSINALALAAASGADIAVKLSQRFCIVSEEVNAVVTKAFKADPALAIICPGRPNPNWIRKGHQQFSRFAILTDVMFMRASLVDPEMIATEYANQLRSSQNYHDCFAEIFWHRVCEGVLGGHYWKCPQITDHSSGRLFMFLRRYQNSPSDYQRIADVFQLGRHVWDLRERANMTKNYDPRPRV